MTAAECQAAAAHLGLPVLPGNPLVDRRRQIAEYLGAPLLERGTHEVILRFYSVKVRTFRNALFVVTEFICVHAGPLSTLAAGTVPVAAVFWQGSSIEKKVEAIDKKITLVKGELHLIKLDVEVIDEKLGKMNDNLLEFVKAVSTAIKGKPLELDILVAKIEKCKQSNGQGYY
ncbi:hypothetical protein L873DRAFT_1786308 [Choiromyces venosus 120613-1]|uniref:Uncharacterized protein n=1 Tax=Choiromyces venosus 120613-1 TaxID=1336337 RepID=A0A3N4K2I9_9PEZI|nr:hypothetical protein L873DRAFT_1786308 [Choiromyces venosus 120613-1]